MALSIDLAYISFVFIIHTLNSVTFDLLHRCRVRSLSSAPTNGHCWELNPRPLNQPDWVWRRYQLGHPSWYVFIACNIRVCSNERVTYFLFQSDIVYKYPNTVTTSAAVSDSWGTFITLGHIMPKVTDQQTST